MLYRIERHRPQLCIRELNLAQHPPRAEDERTARPAGATWSPSRGGSWKIGHNFQDEPFAMLSRVRDCNCVSRP